VHDNLGPDRNTSHASTQPSRSGSRQCPPALADGDAVVPGITEKSVVVVDWYTADDPANPRNWSASKKGFVLAQLALYTLAAYGASSMYVSGEEGVMSEFHIGPAAAAMGLAIYVLGYGVGPLLFAPLSEIASIGRNWLYVPTFFLFVILSIPTAVVKSYAGLLVLRFLQGFFSSPCLANGGATVGDMVYYPLMRLSRDANPFSNSMISWSFLYICLPGQQLLSGDLQLVP
jgi:MFS transporter, DHA1 family, multidrug resistance protein